MGFFIWACLGLFIAVLAISAKGHSNLRRSKAAKLAAMSDKERDEFLVQEKQIANRKRVAKQDWDDRQKYGDLNIAMICPHCNVQGKIRTTSAINKKGVSGGKATAAILTGGVSLLAVGLSRKEKNTQARCGNCTNIWIF